MLLSPFPENLLKNLKLAFWVLAGETKHFLPDRGRVL
jgi:hypothetical protein